MTSPIFEANDTVICRGNPFWMTVRSVNPTTGRCSCNFGNTDNYAGSFSEHELDFYGGTEILARPTLATLPGPRA